MRQLERDGGFGEGMWFVQWVTDDASAEDQAFLRSRFPAPVRWLSAALAGRKYAGLVKTATD